jgi:hypothetical protein
MLSSKDIHDEKNPDRRAYREAIEIIRAKFTKNQEVLQVLKPRHPMSLTIQIKQ